MLQILYFYPQASSFVLKDLSIFKNLGIVRSFECNATPKWKTPWILIQQIIFIFRYRTKKTVFITQFGGYHSFIPTLFTQLFKNNHIIILGGTDCNWLPSIKYGNFQKKLLRWFTYYSLKNCSHLVPVNKELVYSDYFYTNNDFPHQGYKFFFPDILTPYTIIENGVDFNVFKIDRGKERQKNSFLTLCSELQDDRRRLVKGIDLIIKIADLFPDCIFTIAGGNLPASLTIPANIHCLPFFDSSKLPELYQNHQYYMQLSLTEGFPNALIEAMSCGCIPIVSNVGAMPDIVGDIGFILHYKDEILLSEIMRQAIKNYTPDSANFASKQVAQYGLNTRFQKLSALISGLW